MLFYYIGIPLAVIYFSCLAISYIPGIVSWKPKDEKHVLKNVDGLRGVAAFIVIIHHSFLIFQNHLNSKWYPWQGLNKEIEYNIPIRNIISNFGGVGVSIFFMITGFLFFNKAMKSGGFVDVKSFYLKRFNRIAPMYFFSILVMFIMSLTYGLTEFKSLADAIHRHIGWLTFGFFDYHSITDRFQFGRINAGVIWTLAIEWQFYFLYPLICSFCGKKRNAYLFVLVSIITILILNYSGIYNDKKTSIYLCFIIGMAAAILYKRISVLIQSKLISTCASFIGIITLAFSLSYSGNVYTPVMTSFIGLFFILSVSGASLFGLLSSRAMTAAGVISYSVYLMHGLIMNSTLSIMGNNFDHNVFIVISIFLVCMICSLTYLFIEKPFMKPNDNKNNVKPV